MLLVLAFRLIDKWCVEEGLRVTVILRPSRVTLSGIVGAIGELSAQVLSDERPGAIGIHSRNTFYAGL